MARLYRIGVAGAGTLRARELGLALAARRFPALDPTLWEGMGGQGEESEESAAAGPAMRLATFGDDPAVLRPFTAGDLDGLDLVFLAGAMAGQALAPILRDRGIAMVDLSGGNEVSDAVVVGLDPSGELEGGLDGQPWAAVVAHPAAQAMAHLGVRLPRVGAMTAWSAVVHEPASERGWPGIRELEGQATRLLSLKPLPEEVYGKQVAFNLGVALGETATPSLAEVRERIGAQTRRLLGAGAAMPAIELVQAPVFHGGAIALAVRYAERVEAAAVEAALDSALLRRSDWPPDLLAAAGEESIQISRPRPDADQPGTWWLFATFDNLRRTALGAVDAAAALLRLRETRA